VAVELGDERLSYGELDRRADRLAGYLLSLGVCPEERVGVCLERCLELPVSLLAVLEAGGAYVPLDPEYPRERLELMLADSGARVLLTSREGAAAFQASGLSGLRCVVVGQGEDLPAAVESAALPLISADHLAYMIYTSGSTGRPKGVAVPHRGIARLVRETGFVDLGPSEVMLQFTSISFDVSTFEIWGCLLNGGRLVLAPPGATVEEATAVVERHGVTTLWLTSGLFHQAVTGHLPRLRGVRQLLAGGDVVPAGAARRCLEEIPGLRLINGYGPTENTTFTASWSTTDAAEVGAAVPIGWPIAGTETYVLDRHLFPVPAGIVGELYTGGSGLARGYHARPDLTAERFVPHPLSRHAGQRLYRTGDLVRHRPDGALDFLGRADRQVKVRGVRVELAEVETVLAAHSAVREAVVAVVRGGPGDERLAAWVVPAAEMRPSPSDLRSWLGERLPVSMIPSTFTLLAALPTTPNGKIDRAALAGLEAAVEVVYEAPRNPIEEIVAGAWSEVLKRERVGVRDNFFDLGGHSLLAGLVLSRIRGTLGVALSLRAFFQEPTVAALARQIERIRLEQGGLAPRPITRVPRDGRLHLSFAQERLWLVDQLQPGNAAYNSFLPTRLSGRLDLDALERVLAEIQRRHEVLRTRFVSTQDGPVQVIAPASSLAAWRLPLIDLAGLPEEARPGELLRLTGAEARSPFDLAVGPLVRATLLHLGEDEHALLLNLHHSVCDGWSLGVLTRELAALYRAFTAGRPSPLSALPVQYVDYAHWQREWLQGEVLAAQLDWWKGHLGAHPPVLELPFDRPRPKVQSSRGALVGIVLPPDLSAALKACVRRQGGTLFTLLLTGFQTALQRWSHQPRISVGTPVAGRNRVETEGLIGFFVNTLVLCAGFSGDPTAEGLLAQVRDLTLAAFDHQDLPFEKLVAALQSGRDLSRQPLFQVMFALQNNATENLELPDLAMSPIPVTGAGLTQFEMVLSAAETRRGISISLSYNVDLFDRATSLRFLEHLRRLLEAMVEQPGSPASALPLLGEAEIHQLLWEWSGELPLAPARHTWVLDEHRRPVPIGVVGEVFLSGPGFAPADFPSGRFVAGGLAACRGLEKLFATGRRARRRADGALDWVDDTEVAAGTTDESAGEKRDPARRARLEERRSRVSSRREQLSSERLALLQKVLGRAAGSPGAGDDPPG
jgi:amino acid adenylation domain-containing protein